MNTTTTRKKPGKQRSYHHGDLRAALLEAAEAVLEENGIEGFSLRAVAKRAGVSHAAPAHHFKDTGALLTALAAIGYKRFVEGQEVREASSPQNPSDQMIANGLGYVDFAIKHPALFRLIFSSNRTNYEDEELTNAANAAFEKLVSGIGQLRGSDPRTDEDGMVDVLAAWCIVHGIADLLNAGRLGPLNDMPEPQREDVIKRIISRLYQKI